MSDLKEAMLLGDGAAKTNELHDEGDVLMGPAVAVFSTKEYDVTSFCCSLTGCGSSILTLGPEEAAYKISNPCGTSNNHL